MKSVATAEASGVIYNFEPPVFVCDDEPYNPSLARLATIAWYGIGFPRGFRDQTCEESFLQAFSDVNGDVLLTVNIINEVLEGKHTVSAVTLGPKL